MQKSVGKKLSKARLDRGLSIDEAAHATKLRPDKILALESDDYARFANTTYAKGFLNIYARFLKVDVSEATRTMDNANPISVADYQYLSNAPAPRPSAPSALPRRREPPSLVPLFAFGLVALVGVLAMWVYVNNQRIVGEPGPRVREVEASAPAAPAITPMPAQKLDLPDVNSLAAENSIPLELAPAANTATPANDNPLVAPGDHDFVTPSAVTASIAPSGSPGGLNEILVASTRKTWVTIRKDDPKAPPVFEDYLWPGTVPLKLKGARFFIEAREPAAVQITKNGLPFAYQSASVPVQ